MTKKIFLITGNDKNGWQVFLSEDNCKTLDDVGGGLKGFSHKWKAEEFISFRVKQGEIFILIDCHRLRDNILKRGLRILLHSVLSIAKWR